MRTLFKNPRTLLATATTSAALIAAGGRRILLLFGSDTPTVRQVTVGEAHACRRLLQLGGRDLQAQPEGRGRDHGVRGLGGSNFGGDGGTQQAQGSGFVFDEQGHVITNEHVVDGAEIGRACFSNGERPTPATVVGSDPSTDLAVIDVDGLRRACSSRFGPGDVATRWRSATGVIAIGSPFGLEGTVTAGIVSALDREIHRAERLRRSTTRSRPTRRINHGNSGGPLLDLDRQGHRRQLADRERVGRQRRRRLRDPLEHRPGIVAQLIEGGSSSTPTSASIAGPRAPTASRSRGCVDHGGCGCGTGAGDVVTAVDGDSVSSSDDLRELVDAHAPGDSVTLTVSRNGDTRTLRVVLGTRPTA